MSQAVLDHLLQAVETLSPGELEQLAERLAQRKLNGLSEDDLRQQLRLRLPSDEDNRLRELISRSERGLLAASETAEYQELARTAEQVSLQRVRALAELARRWGKPLHETMALVGWDYGSHGAE